jgi:LPS export ABC transporter protein LptC
VATAGRRRAEGSEGCARRRGSFSGWCLAGGVIVLALAGCGRADEPGSRPELGELPTSEVRNFQLRTSDAGRLEWILHADYAASYSQRGRINARKIAIDFYDERGRKYSHLTAREGTVQQPANDMEARGDVVITTQEGVRVETSSLRYLTRERRIVSDAFVKLTRNGDVVSGVGFESDPSLEHFTLKREVRARVESAGPGLRFRER